MLRSSRIGIWRHKRRPTLRSASVSTGDKENGTDHVLLGEAACAAAAQLPCSGYARLWAAARAQTAEFNETKLPKTRTILGLMRLNFLCVSVGQTPEEYKLVGRLRRSE